MTSSEKVPERRRRRTPPGRIDQKARSNPRDRVAKVAQVAQAAPSNIFERRVRRFHPNDGDLRVQLRDMDNATHIDYFCSVLAGKHQVHNQVATGLDGGGASSSTDHDNKQPRDAELEILTTTLWFPEFINKADITSEYSFRVMRTAFNEVMKFGLRAPDLTTVFARMDSEHVEFLLEYPEDLRSTLQGIATDMETAPLGHILFPESPIKLEED